MRAQTFVGLVGLTVLIIGCGGTSSGGDDGKSTEGGSGSETAGAPPEGSGHLTGGGGAGVTSGGTAGAGSPGPGKGGRGGTPGSSAGGSPSGPSAGAPNVAEGCMPYSQSSGMGYCQLSMMCKGGRSLNSTCKDRGDGRLDCYCDNGLSFAANYTIEGVSGLAACEAIADVCATGGEPAFEGPEECSPIGTKSAAQCDLQEQCTRRLAVNEAVSVSVSSSSSYVSCYDSGLGTLACQCDKGQQYQLEGADGNTGCDIVQDLCRDDAEPTTEPTCTPTGQSTGPGYCQMDFECNQTAEVQGGVIAKRSDRRYASCQSANGQASRCTCQRSDGTGIQFDFEGTATLATCDTAASLCDDATSIEPTGTMTCESSSQTVQQGTCYSVVDCAQDATLGDLNVKVHGNLQATCTATDSGLSCTCVSGAEQASATFASTGDLWADCTAAADQCRELVEVQVGTTGGGVGPIPPMRPFAAGGASSTPPPPSK